MRLFIVFGLIWCFSSYSLAQQPVQSSQHQKVVAAPVVLKADDNNKSALGVVIADNNPIPDNSLDIIRKELHRLAARDQAIAEERGWLKSVNYRFTPESMTFFVAIGAVTFNSMWIKSHGDPLAMERHILALKDPIAHISFYSFMMANGYYINLRTKHMDPVTKAQMMRRLSYQGMAVGSLAASISADLGNTAKICVGMWLNGRDDAESQAACNMTLKQWTARNKFQQYFPQVLHMWISQAATEVIDGAARKGFASLSATQTIQKFLSKPFLVETAHKMVGVEALIEVSAGTPVMRALKWSGKLVQFSMFVGIDHLLMPITYRPLNNLIRPMTFDFDALAINNFVNAADSINWNDKNIAAASKTVCSIREPNCLADKLTKELEAFGAQSQQWREHLNSDAEMDLAGWMEMTKKILSQLDYSYKFYKNFLEEYFKVASVKHNLKTGKVTEDAWNHITGYPLRTLPLYGVRLSEKPDLALDKNIKPEEVYLLEPQNVEKSQMDHIKTVVELIEKSMKEKPLPIKGEPLSVIVKILNQLKSDKILEIQAGLLEMNSYLGVNSKFGSRKEMMYPTQFYEILIALRDVLGNPMPNVYPFATFADAFDNYPANKSAAEQADFSLWSTNKKYTFRKDADLMIYQAFCGPEKGLLEKKTWNPSLFGYFKREINIFNPQFVSPSVLKPSAELKAYCSEWRKTRDFVYFKETLYGQNIGGKPMDQFFQENFNTSIFGDLSNMDGFKQFDTWWVENARKQIDPDFRKYDQQYKVLVQKTHDNILGHHSYFNWGVDQLLNHSKYLQKTLKDQLNFEANLYLQLVSRALQKDYVVPVSDKHKYLETIVKLSKEERFKSVYGYKAQAEVQKVWELINTYYSFALQDNVQFNSYIAHSKKIDTAINEILVQAGLKKYGPATKAEADLFKAVEQNKAASADSTSANEEEPEMTAAEKEEMKRMLGGLAAAPDAATGTESSEKIYSDIQVEKPTLRQKAIVSAVQGLRAVEGEIRRLIRMKVSLAKTLEVDSEEYLKDFMNTNQQSKPSGPRRFSPYGQ